MRITVKACIFCRHCSYEEPYSYSTHTSGGGIYECLKRVWYAGSDLGSADMLETAQQCRHFDLRDDIKKYLQERKS